MIIDLRFNLPNFSYWKVLGICCYLLCLICILFSFYILPSSRSRIRQPHLIPPLLKGCKVSLGEPTSLAYWAEKELSHSPLHQGIPVLIFFKNQHNEWRQHHLHLNNFDGDFKMNQNDLSESYWVSIITYIHFTRQWLKCHWTFLDSFLVIYPIRFALVVWEFHTVHSVIFTNWALRPAPTQLFLLYNLVFSFTFSNFTSASCCPYLSRDVWISTTVWSYYQREDFFRKMTLPVPEATTTLLNNPRIIVSRQETSTHQFPSYFKV